MFNFKDTKGMMPTAMEAYIEELHTEIRNLNAANKKLTIADHFESDKSGGGFTSEQELIDDMEIGEVAEVVSYKKFGQDYKVKISKHRIDGYPTRIEAEHVGMLHSV